MSRLASYRAAEQLARALMFEGYVLYPYRRSSLKNMQRFAFGTLKPAAACAPGTSEASALRLECLVEGEAPAVAVSVRFLQYASRKDASDSEPWLEAIERACELELPDVRRLPMVEHGVRIDHDVPGELASAPSSTREARALRVRMTAAAEPIDARHTRLRVDVENASAGVETLHALGAVHVLLRAGAGSRFVSLLEPAPELAEAAAACRSRGCFPVLAGEPGDDGVLLASPIILYDRPVIAKESAGDFCDATEIDEMLSLRVLTLTEAEQREARHTDPKSRAIIERTLAQSEDALLALHGARREPLPTRETPETLEPERAATQPRAFAPGDAVRLLPRRGGDVLDLALAGERATIASVEEDFEGRVHYAVTVDADPGRDLGALGMPGHRFFFSADELERVP